MGFRWKERANFQQDISFPQFVEKSVDKNPLFSFSYL